MVVCLTCKKETKNPKFCSKSCSAKYNNVIYPKRKTSKTCIDCGLPLKSYKYNRCEQHYEEYKTKELLLSNLDVNLNLTIEDLITKYQIPNRSVNKRIRDYYTPSIKKLKELPCAICGYDKHVDICHIKAIKSFPKTALLKDINNLNNIIQLCKNCHWELDEGWIKIDATTRTRI